MVYFITSISKMKNDDTYSKGIYQETDIVLARKKYHQQLTSAYSNANLEYVLVYITNQYGHVEQTENYEAPVEEPTPEPEGE